MSRLSRDVPTSPPAHPAAPAQLWEPPPQHFDSRWPWPVKLLIMLVLLALAFVVDRAVAQWVLAAPRFPDLGVPGSPGSGDIKRELMFLEQFGQWTCSVVVIVAVALLDRLGRRRALAIALACLVSVLATYGLKDLVSRTRPGVLQRPAVQQQLHITEPVQPGQSAFLGPFWGSKHDFGSFPSAHTTGAFALACALSWFYPRGRGLFYALALITAAQRVLHAAHYVSDVIAGMLLAIVAVRLVLYWNVPARLLRFLPAGWQAWILEPNGEVPPAD
jgi:membrane-associated phospholipid phosphatase